MFAQNINFVAQDMFKCVPSCSLSSAAYDVSFSYKPRKSYLVYIQPWTYFRCL